MSHAHSKYKIRKIMKTMENTHMHTPTQPKYSKEKKVLESYLLSKGNQK